MSVVLVCLSWYGVLVLTFRERERERERERIYPSQVCCYGPEDWGRRKVSRYLGLHRQEGVQFILWNLSGGLVDKYNWPMVGLEHCYWLEFGVPLSYPDCFFASS